MHGPDLYIFFVVSCDQRIMLDFQVKYEKPVSAQSSGLQADKDCSYLIQDPKS